MQVSLEGGGWLCWGSGVWIQAGMAFLAGEGGGMDPGCPASDAAMQGPRFLLFPLGKQVWTENFRVLTPHLVPALLSGLL